VAVAVNVAVAVARHLVSFALQGGGHLLPRPEGEDSFM
jgi:hypothetical protein